MVIHAIDIDHPPGIGIADDIAAALEMVYAHAATVTRAAIMMGVGTLFNARRAPPPLALARRRAFDALPSGASLGPHAIRIYRPGLLRID
jgi:hypothetical protein